jgi:competence protein ComEC
LLPALFWKTPSPPAGEMTVVVADVGQGQAVLVRTAQHVLLYDAGPRYAPDVDAGQRVVVPLLRSLGWRLDRLVLSHRDTDHTGGARAVLAMHPNADVLGSLPADLPWTRHPGYQTCEAGQRWTWDGVHFEVLHPQASAPRRAVSNASSCVLRIQAASGSLLLSGDIEAPEEAALVSRLGARLQTDVLLVPHHGSKTSSSLAWLAQVQPQWAWVQAGYRNRFGHPAQAVVARYQAQGIGWLETAGCGAIIWSSQTPQAMTCERAQQARYWHHRAP